MVTAVQYKRQRPLFSTLHLEGALLTIDVLQRIEQLDANLDGMSAHDYHRNGYRLNEVITDAWSKLLYAWKSMQHLSTPLTATASQKMTLERWLLPLFHELGYGRLLPLARPVIVDGKRYAISHFWQHTPIHLTGFQQPLDEVVHPPGGSFRSSAYGLVQTLLNRSDDHLWGIVSNGLTLRLLRKNVSMARQAYIEFDLEAMMRGEAYADFALLWLLCHQSRFEADRPVDCWLEQWAKTAHEQGIRALDQLREGVEQAINVLGKGFLTGRGSKNQALREKLHSGNLSGQDYYRQVLRLVYRLIVLFVAEDRDVLLSPDAGVVERQRYLTYYSTRRLRNLAERRMGTQHTDLFQGLLIVMEKQGYSHGSPELGMPALNGFLFSPGAIPDLLECNLTNHALLDAIRSLAHISDKKTGRRRPVDYKHLGPEELGSVYESLLELYPELTIGEAGPTNFRLRRVGGSERKTSGSYYTPTSLVDCLLDSALDPVIERASRQPEPARALLDLKVCDPACGSGHFLIAAAYRIAKKLAEVRTGDEEPGPEFRRKALREVISSCIYGVDINPMAVELCKVNLWINTIEPGKPFSFFDTHILCGNSLLGATPALLAQGLPDKAFEAVEGDDRKLCTKFKKNNQKHLTGQNTLFNDALLPWNHHHNLRIDSTQQESINDYLPENVHMKHFLQEQTQSSRSYTHSHFLADAWCAAFVWKKTEEFAPFITYDTLRSIERNPDSIPTWMRDEIKRLARQYQFFHWHLAFPYIFKEPESGKQPENVQAGWSGGFDVVLGNPPWERIKIQEKEWFASRQAEITNASNAAVRRKMIAALEQDNPVLFAAFKEDQRKAIGESHFVRSSGRYPLCGKGDVNTYAIFAENMRTVIVSTGKAGCIVPSGIATDDTTKTFFQNIMTTRSLASLYDFDNTNKLFPDVDSRYKFCLLTLTGSSTKIQSQEAQFAFFLHNTADLQDPEKVFSLSAKDIKLINPNTQTCPIFRTKRDMRITKSIYERVPILLKDDQTSSNAWDIKFMRMFDMANASHLFLTRDQLENNGWLLKGNIFYRDGIVCLPLYEGKMTSHYNHRYGTYQEISAKTDDRVDNQSALWQDPLYTSLPRYWIHEKDMDSHIYPKQKALLAYRDIARSTDMRTSIFSILPVAACGDTLHIVSIGTEAMMDKIFFASCACSFIFDYVARQKLGGTHLKYFLMKQLPILSAELYKRNCPWNNHYLLNMWIIPRALELTYTAWDLEPFARDCGYHNPPFRWDEERRFLLRCELDAAYFHLYGIEHDDVDYIMDTFRVWKQKEEKQIGKYRTKRVILEIYDEMQQAIETGEPYQARLDPLPADPCIAHPSRNNIEALPYTRGKIRTQQ